jgi:phthiocerol/phenolphthiocerol synthesis type-I polyketide synthase E
MTPEMTEDFSPGGTDAVAVIGMAGRFPGAQDVAELWRNLRGGVESIRSFTPEELIAAGSDPDLVARPDYVPAAALLEDGAAFDAAFFGLNRRQAEILDPQHRLFLECAVAALEDAGYDPSAHPGAIGLYGGAGWTTYLSRNLLPRPELREALGTYQLVLSNDKDFLCTRVAYHLNLRGPCLTVQTACSTSLVAVHLACQALLNGECDLALAGGVSMSSPLPHGYLYQEGGILSPDGHCRAFDARARGTVGGQGVGLVVLKSLRDAVADGDHVRAVIRGSAVNNDGWQKAGYTAPSLERQREVVKEALGIAGVDAATVSYVEAHGTGTELGDPIEVAALTEAFRATTDGVGFCALGSIKTNLGHLDAAAGVASLIKTVLALEHGEIPPSLHYESANSRIDFAASPFYVNARLAPWPRGASPRRAGVSSAGIGGTNAHLVVEEAPAREPGSPGRAWQLLTLSARSAPALERATARLARHLKRHPGEMLADVAYTLRVGRRDFEERRFAVCRDGADAVAVLTAPGSPRAVAARRPDGEPAVVFLFPGQGAQRIGMGRELYASEAVFRRELDHCAEVLLSEIGPEIGRDLRQALYPALTTPGSEAEIDRTDIAQSALFAVEYALARLWQSWGIEPRAMIGHSVGEYVAACLAGVFRLEDALRLVAVRSRLLAALPGGVMLAVSLPAAELAPLLGPELDLAAINAPARSVAAGPEAAIAGLEARLAGRRVACRRLRTSHAFHSAAVEPAMTAFAQEVARVERQAPRIPFLSNVTGSWITATQATDPEYWSRHLRLPVRFADGLRELAGQVPRVLLEVGPGKTLGTLARQGDAATGARVVASLPDPGAQGEMQSLLTAAGELWLTGVPLDGAAFQAGERRFRVPLPTYPFERRPYWIEPPPSAPPAATPAVPEPAAGDLLETLGQQLATLSRELQQARAGAVSHPAGELDA